MRHQFSVADGTDMVALDYFVPPTDLMPYFGAMYLFTANKPHFADHTRADFAQIRLMIAGSGAYHFSDGRMVETPSCCLLGPTSMATHFNAIGPMQVLGVTVLPAGWVALHIGDAHEAADRVIDLAQRFGPQWLALLDRLREIENPDEAVEQFWGFLRTALHPVSPSDQKFIAAIDSWLSQEYSPQIEALQSTTGLSPRQVARLCNRLYGAPPKYLARKYRALRCAQSLAREQVDWSECCGDAFYDQSHFIREIKHFTGLTPTELRDRASVVIRLSMNRAELGEGIAPLSRNS